MHALKWPIMHVMQIPESFNESMCSLKFAQKVNACEIGTARKNVKVETESS